MSNLAARRGRPKGTGLDDRARLKTVAAILASKPDLKTTTAIKSTGVTDPSTIRRLRDKFHECRDELMAEVSNAAPRANAAAPGRAQPSRGPIASDEPQAAQNLAKFAGSALAGTAGGGLMPAVSSWATSAFDANPWVAAWCAFQIRAANTVLDAQLGMFQQMMTLPPVTFAMRQQIALNDMTLAFCAPPRARHLLH